MGSVVHFASGLVPWVQNGCVDESVRWDLIRDHDRVEIKLRSDLQIATVFCQQFWLSKRNQSEVVEI